MTQPIQLLLIDDNRSDRLLVLRELQREFEQLNVQEIISSGEFNRAVRQGDFDAVITDFQLRWTTGLEILEAIKERYPDCPVIMFTNTGTEEIAVEAMKLGLDDYILKEPNRYVRVPSAVRAAIERAITKKQAALLEIRFRALLEKLKIGVFRVSEAYELLECNPAFLTLLGVESIDQARSLLRFSFFSSLIQSASTAEIEKQELDLQRGDGQHIKVLLTMIVTRAGNTTVIDGILEESI
ncbi:response regulator [Leptolyngbya sp. FACHB-711]|uniref:response regulator n=1 Tax=Leptolyngbya sp. FACHB-711 TaxID=2692813 RepID=UPI0016885164|nr:response regulator [Leptolyngbya sp. FACHB-711]MBD2026162.1 response regulator [Leptolyngbya sp. FACHB-711]